MDKRNISFGTIVAMIGSILISLGVAWLIAQNWHQIPAPIKIFILLLATVGAYSTGAMLRIKNYPGTGKALIVLGGLLYTLSIFLIAQIFFTRTGPQGIAWLLLIAWVGVTLASYIFESSASLVIALIEFLIWIVAQFIAFSDAAGKSLGILAFYFLFTGILLYGLSIIHRVKKHRFSSLYQFWTAFYFLAFTYILSFQVLLPMIWPKDVAFSTSAIIFLFFLGILSISILVMGIFFTLHNRIISDKELLGMICIMVLLAVLVGITSFTADKNDELITWAIWLIINVAFILIILAIIGYGSWLKLPNIINLGIVFFALDIVTRYIGFIMDFWGYTSLSIIFITGGGILLVGGWLIERWRRKLIKKVEERSRD